MNIFILKIFCNLSIILIIFIILLFVRADSYNTGFQDGFNARIEEENGKIKSFGDYPKQNAVYIKK